MKWLPIESAPKDGTVFLAYRPLAEKTNDPVIKLVKGVGYDNTCWAATVPIGADSTNYTDGMCKATHWLPLPPPPVDTSAIKARNEALVTSLQEAKLREGK